MIEKQWPQPSATVVLVRDAAHVPEVFLVRRKERSSFGGAFAYPGGVVDAADQECHDCCVGISEPDANALLDLDDGATSYYVAAIRELFEETGVLLADCRLTATALESARAALNNRAIEWNEFVRTNSLELRCDTLNYFDHWITPIARTRRYTTRFFIAEMPSGQCASHDPSELTGGEWKTAQAALQAREEGSMLLHFPTVTTLEAIAEHDSVAALREWAQGRARAGVRAIQPVISATGEPYIPNAAISGEAPG